MRRSATLLQLCACILAVLSVVESAKNPGFRTDYGGWDGGVARARKWLLDLVTTGKIATPLEEAEPTTFKLLVAGLPRTGSTVVAEALRELGYHPLHGPEATLFADDIASLYSEGITQAQLFEKIGQAGYDAAGFDAMGHIWQWAAEDPDVKVILTVSDTAESWARDMLPLLDLHKYLTSPPLSWFSVFSSMGPSIDDLFRNHVLNKPKPAKEGEDETEAAMRNLMVAYNKRRDVVKNSVPPERLLLYNIRQGYAPLCMFLGIDRAPNSYFPRVSDKQAVEGAMFVLWILSLWPAAILVLYLVVRRTCLRGKAKPAPVVDEAKKKN